MPKPPKMYYTRRAAARKRSRLGPFWSLSEKKQDAILWEAAQKAYRERAIEAPDRPPTPVEEEVFLRDMFGQLLLLGGAKAEEIDFLYSAEPDGSRVKGLNRLVCKCFESSTPAGRLAHDSSLVDNIVDDCHTLGIVGERNLVLAIYLIGTSRLLDRPLSGIVQGPSSTGKSYIVETVARLFPTEDVLHATKMTPQALFYYEGGLSNKFVVAGERSRKQDDDAADATAGMRQLQSEGRITKLVTESKDGKFTSRTVEQVGPIAYVETTTLQPGQIFAEDLNRALLLATNESEEHTRKILEHAASRYEAKPQTDVTAIIEKHCEFQRMLRKHKVVIPFARELVDQLPARKVEARRVGTQILCVIEAVTLLHQLQRERDKQGRLIATHQDYEIAKAILVVPLGQSLGVPDSPAKLFDKLTAKFPGAKIFITKDAQKVDLEASNRSVTNWLRQLAEHGCIEKVAPAKGPKPAQWRLTGKTPQQAVLPDLSSR